MRYDSYTSMLNVPAISSDFFWDFTETDWESCNNTNAHIVPSYSTKHGDILRSNRRISEEFFNSNNFSKNKNKNIPLSSNYFDNNTYSIYIIVSS